jgi:hypothetical protein
MSTKGRGLRILRLLVPVSSIINALLAVNFFPLVPLLGWLNFGRAGWTTAWIPEAAMLLVLPAGYFVYWHYGLIVAGAALALALCWWRRTGASEARLWTITNGATIAVYLAVRIILAAQGVRPDSV